MILPFRGSYPVNQIFNDSCCQAYYHATFGWIGHNGIDYGLPVGTPVVAAMSGTIFSAYDTGGAGNYIYISTPTLECVYMHLSRRDVNTGQSVTEGQQIGLSGNTGNSTGPHLHFGVRPIPYNGNNGFEGYVDPQPFFKGGVVDYNRPVDKNDLIRLANAYFFNPGQNLDAFLGKGIVDVMDEFASSEQRKQVEKTYAAGSNSGYVPVNEALYRKK